MIFNEVTKRLFDSAVKKLQGNIDNIQTTSRATLSTAGWYRVAEFTSTIESVRKGSSANSCVVVIKKMHDSKGSEEYTIKLRSVYTSQEFKCENAKVNGTQQHTKIRYTVDSGKAYIELYSTGTGNTTFVEINSPQNAHATWQAITPTLTAETVDGVTVTTTYDIPANASPVTDLDLAQVDGTAYLGTSILEKAKELPIGIHEFILDGSSTVATGLPSGYYHYGTATIRKTGGSNITILLWGCYNGSESVAINHTGDRGNTWNGWKIFATTEDLANYFKNTGGTLTGKQRFNYNGRIISLEITSNGDFYIWDETNNKAILHSTLASNGTFNGTATGNLPLTGGLITGSASLPLAIKNTNGNTIAMQFVGKDGNMGSLGFTGYDTPVFIDKASAVAKQLLHTGNSAKVVFTESDTEAPSDTTALWAHL